MIKSMTKYVSVLISVFALLVFTACASKQVIKRESTLPYTYNQLKLYDIDEMIEITENRMALYSETGELSKLDEIMTLILARPNDDNILERLMLSIRYTLDSNKLWEEAVERIVDNAVANLKDESTSAGDQVSYLMVLQNLLVEFKPEFSRLDVSPKFEQNIVQKIADAEIEVSEEARRDASLNLFGKLVSPSEIALQVLKEVKSRPQPKNDPSYDE